MTNEMTPDLLALERRAIERHLAKGPVTGSARDELLLRLVFTSVAMARAAKFRTLTTDTKADDSPVTELDRAIETRIRSLVDDSEIGAVVVGEEQGGAFSGRGRSIAVDPIDGTWAFLNATAGFSTSLAVFEDREVVAAAVANPSTGEVIYTTGHGARSLRLEGELDACRSRPLPREQRGADVSLHLHPSRAMADASARSLEAWAGDELRSVTLAGGSPAWALAECARGALTYVNLWASHRTQPYDLAAAVAILRAAGGDAVDVKGKPIDALEHRGPFVASVSAAARGKVIALLAFSLAGPSDS
jgi:myo-inositol-1(or 4)-monophosphatase